MEKILQWIPSSIRIQIYMSHGMGVTVRFILKKGRQREMEGLYDGRGRRADCFREDEVRRKK